MWDKIVTPIKFGWYTLWAGLGFKFGKDALAAMAKEKMEKTVEAVKEVTSEKKDTGEKSPETS